MEFIFWAVEQQPPKTCQDSSRGVPMYAAVSAVFVKIAVSILVPEFAEVLFLDHPSKSTGIAAVLATFDVGETELSFLAF